MSVPKVKQKALKQPKPDFAPTLRRDMKVLCVLSVPRLVDTLCGPRVVYVSPDGRYKDSPWDDDPIVADEAEGNSEGDAPEVPFDPEKEFPWRRTRT